MSSTSISFIFFLRKCCEYLGCCSQCQENEYIDNENEIRFEVEKLLERDGTPKNDYVPKTVRGNSHHYEEPVIDEREHGFWGLGRSRIVNLPPRLQVPTRLREPIKRSSSSEHNNEEEEETEGRVLRRRVWDKRGKDMVARFSSDTDVESNYYEGENVPNKEEEEYVGDENDDDVHVEVETSQPPLPPPPPIPEDLLEKKTEEVEDGEEDEKTEVEGGEVENKGRKEEEKEEEGDENNKLSKKGDVDETREETENEDEEKEEIS